MHDSGQYMVAMAVSGAYSKRVTGRVRPGTGEIEVRIKTPDTEAGRKGIDKMVEMTRKILTRKTKKKVRENLLMVAGYGLCLVDGGLVAAESIRDLIAAAECIAESKIASIKEERRREKAK